jgi:hypothetical protein
MLGRTRTKMLTYRHRFPAVRSPACPERREVAEAKDRTHSSGSADTELVRFSDADRFSSSTKH